MTDVPAPRATYSIYHNSHTRTAHGGAFLPSKMMLSSPIRRRSRYCLLMLVLRMHLLGISAFVSAPPRALNINVSHKTGRLFANNTTNVPTNEDVVIQDTRLLAGDVISVALASQLLGLADTLNDPNFWKQGGWFQPMSATESTLPTLVQRDSILTICWVISALAWKGYAMNNKTAEESQSSIGSMAVTFCVLRVALGFIMSLVSHVDFDVWDTIRQCYYSIILIGSFRLLYNQYSQ